MPRNAEKNEEVRECRKKQILDAALNVYIRYGYHAADMDFIAKEAKLAKGLMYYYYKTKNELFKELLTLMFNEGYTLSNAILENLKGLNPVEQLMMYTYKMFLANRDNPRMMQFYMRVPFDAFAIIGADQWKEGAEKSDLHRKTLTDIIKKGITVGVIQETNPSSAANSFWSVFVANVFEYSKMMTGKQEPINIDTDIFRNVVKFCFQGLGIEYKVWNSCLENIVLQNKNGNNNENI